MTHPVVAGVDGSERSLAAADWAVREAELRGVPLRLVHASPPLPGSAVPGPAVDRLHQIGARMLQQAAAELGDRCPEVEVRGEQVDDDAVVALLAAARDAGLVVVGTRGTGGFDGLALGRVALRVAAAAPRPVVLVPDRSGAFGSERPGTLEGETHGARGAAQVVVGFDAHRPVSEVADFAFSAAEARGAGLRAVQAWALPAEAVSSRTLVVTEEDRGTWEDQEVLRLSDVLRPWQEKYPGVAVRADVMLLHPAEALLNASQRAALLVVGRRSDPQAPEGHMGPITHAVLHHARCPVAVVPYGG
ncbi:universal stress protein [Streptomyces carpinensis]|uniref:Universal stress protein n=1 Tax=Streptomyces carpinensis TaxID=66369 RepID=A0ABV1WAT5_9ACTN|nr:universal stress protein [Streptomyces carpinensis]